jgi:hypothetical protein
VTKADKLFEFLVKEGRIKLPKGILCFDLMESRKKDTAGFKTGILTPSMSAGFSG